MSHHHDHDDHHSHGHHHDGDHDHGHSHNHDREVQSEMSLEAKMVKLLDHWIRHNDDHAETYRSWAEKARENRMEAAAALLMEAAQMTLAINGKFEEAMSAITPSQPS